MKNTLMIGWGLGIAIGLIVATVSAIAFAAEGGKSGPEVFAGARCQTCHSVEVAGIARKPNHRASDLSVVGKTYSAEFLKSYLKKETAIDDKLHPTVFRGEPQDLEALALWMASLKGK